MSWKDASVSDPLAEDYSPLVDEDFVVNVLPANNSLPIDDTLSDVVTSAQIALMVFNR